MHVTTIFVATLAVLNPWILAAPAEPLLDNVTSPSSISVPDEVLLNGYIAALESSNVTRPQLGFGSLLKGLLGVAKSAASGKGDSGGLDITKLLGTKHVGECLESCRVYDKPGSPGKDFAQACGKWTREHGNEGSEGMFSRACRPCMQRCKVCPSIRELPCMEYAIPCEADE